METNYIGINGAAGRIGKLNLYQLLQLETEDIEAGHKPRAVVRAINDLAPTDAIINSYRKRDQTHGNLGFRVEKLSEDRIEINGNKVMVFHKRNPAEIPWSEYGVRIVSECSGAFKDRESAQTHLQGGAERVVISMPAKGVDGTFAMAVNHESYNPQEHYVISNASCTTKALAVPLKALMDNGIKMYAVLMDTTHAATNSQRVLQFFDEYGALNEIQTAKTGAAIATSELIPALERKMDGYALRVPTTDGSFANIYFVAAGEDISVGNLNRILKTASEDPSLLGRLDYFAGEEASSTDIIGNTASSIIVASKTKVIHLPFSGENGMQLGLCGLCSGYDNELGPSRDLAMLLRYIASDV